MPAASLRAAISPPASAAAWAQSFVAYARRGVLMSCAAAAWAAITAKLTKTEARLSTGILDGTREVNGIGRGRTRVPAGGQCEANTKMARSLPVNRAVKQSPI